MSRPAVSALLPIYNGMPFLHSAIIQISQNMSEQDEIIVVDDNSDDGSFEILLNWSKIDSRVNLIKKSKGNEGLVKSLNLGCREAKNEWIARFDVDDTYENGRIHKQMNELAINNYNVAAIFSDYKFISENGLSLGTIPSAIYSEAVELSLATSQRTAHPSVLFNKEAVTSVGGYREKDYLVEDLSLWIRLAKVGRLISIPEVLLEYRLHRKSTSQMNHNLMNLQRNNLWSELQLSSSTLELSEERILEILDSYSNLPLGMSRSLLFVRDLSFVKKAKKLQNFKKEIDFMIHISKKYNLNELIVEPYNLIAYRQQRRKYRGII